MPNCSYLYTEIEEISSCKKEHKNIDADTTHVQNKKVKRVSYSKKIKNGNFDAYQI
jgi:hypothetical protein